MRAIDLRRQKLLLAGAGLLLGERWKQAMARRLGVSVGMVNRWAAGRDPVPRWVLEKLKTELVSQHARIAEVLAEVPA